MAREYAPEWTDALGQTFRPGDLISVASINDRSPQMVIAEVVTINLTDPKGNRYYTAWNSPAFAEGKYPLTKDSKPTVTVTAIPLHDGRGFYRRGARKVTYSIVDNILALPGKTVADVAA